MCQLSLCRGQSLLFFVRDCSLQRWHLSTWWEALALKAGSNLKEGKLHGYYTIHDLCWASPRGTAVTLKEGSLSQHGSLVGQLAPFHPCASLGLWIAGGAAHFSSTISTVYLGIQSLGVALCCIPSCLSPPTVANPGRSMGWSVWKGVWKHCSRKWLIAELDD